jgi:hypothetical protein
MRAALTFLLMAGAVIAADKPNAIPDEAKWYHWLVLDKSPRARTESIWNTIEVTKAEFRRMQQRYRPQDFDTWAKRLRQLRPGMTEKQINQILQPKTISYEVSTSQTVQDTIILCDAYFAVVFVDPQSKRMIAATLPLANTYKIKEDREKTPKT